MINVELYKQIVVRNKLFAHDVAGVKSRVGSAATRGITVFAWHDSLLMVCMKTNDGNSEDDVRKAHDVEKLVPPTLFGKAIDAQASALLSIGEIAVVFYKLVKNRLQHVNSWSNIAGLL
jgi:hypothetical protein